MAVFEKAFSVSVRRVSSKPGLIFQGVLHRSDHLDPLPLLTSLAPRRWPFHTPPPSSTQKFPPFLTLLVYLQTDAALLLLSTSSCR